MEKSVILFIVYFLSFLPEILGLSFITIYKPRNKNMTDRKEFPKIFTRSLLLYNKKSGIILMIKQMI